jgi:hypothetical protein
MDPKTATRYQNAKGDEVIQYLSAQARSEELEQIGHEAEALKVLRALEEEGWMKELFPPWTAAKADEEKLKTLHDQAVELLLQGVHADMSAAQMQLLTAKLSQKDLAALKKLMVRPGFVEEWNSLDSMAAEFAKVLLAKENLTPSIGFKLFTTYDPEAILWLGFTSKDPAVAERFRLFLKVWPEVRQRLPHSLMQEMRITPDLPAYREIVQSVFLEMIDGKLTTNDEIRAFLSPHSPPAPPPQVTIKRPRAKRGAEAKIKDHGYDDDEEDSDSDLEDDDLDDIGGDDDEIDLGLTAPEIALEVDIADEPGIGEEIDGGDDSDDTDDTDEADEPEPKPATKKSSSKGSKRSAASESDSDSESFLEEPTSGASKAKAKPAKAASKASEGAGEKPAKASKGAEAKPAKKR